MNNTALLGNGGPTQVSVGIRGSMDVGSLGIIGDPVRYMTYVVYRIFLYIVCISTVWIHI